MAAQQAGRGVVAVGHGLVALGQQAEQQVLGAEVVVVEALGLQAAEVGHDAGLLGGLDHVATSPPGAVPVGRAFGGRPVC
jgi:hypothetical protein